MNLEKKLYKSNKNKMLGGVCGGLGEYFSIDPTLVRLGFVALCVLAGGGLIAYIIALVIIPEAPAGYDPGAKAAPEAPKPEGEQTSAAAEDNDTENGSSNGDTPTLI